MKLKDLLACAATGMILCTSCIKNEAPNAEADILNCTLPEGILTDAIINYNAPFDGEINAYPEPLSHQPMEAHRTSPVRYATR